MVGKTEQRDNVMASIEQINAFINVYELGGYSAAAKKLFKSRSTIRELILTLEEDYDLVFFEVQGRSVKPTVTADRIYVSAKLVQVQLSSFSALASSLKEGEETKITLHYDTMLPTSFITDLTAQMLSKFPFLELHWKVSNWQSSMNAIAENATSITFMPTKKRNFTDVKIKVSLLGDIAFGVYCGKNAHFYSGQDIPSAILRDLPQIVPESFLSSDLNDYMRYSARTVLVADNEAACDLLTKVGWAYLPAHSAEKHVKAGRLLPLKAEALKVKYIKVGIAASQMISVNQGPAMRYLNSLLVELALTHFD